MPSAQRKKIHQGVEGEEEETSEPVSVPVVGLVVAIMCVLAIIIYFQVRTWTLVLTNRDAALASYIFLCC